jgi:hypothetical protein
LIGLALLLVGFWSGTVTGAYGPYGGYYGGAARVARFAIGSPTYTVNDVEYEMDVAPYISGGRTYLAVRYVSIALGVAEENIGWDPATETVTLARGSHTLMLRIGSTVMYVDGRPVEMDVAPEVVEPGRTMLPARWIAEALGGQVEWDEATQTVTITSFGLTTSQPVSQTTTGQATVQTQPVTPSQIVQQTQASRINITDDFSQDTGYWQYYGKTYRDPHSGYIVLTSPYQNEAGAMWLRQENTGPFAAEFSYYAGGGTGGDGFTFMFYKDKAIVVGASGRDLGFGGEGYAIEFDSYSNFFGDPGGKHIALIKNNTKNHLRWVNDARVADAQWHRARVEVYERVVAVYVDGQKVLEWGGDTDRRHGGIGFSAATGESTNWHLIDNVVITPLQ